MRRPSGSRCTASRWSPTGPSPTAGWTWALSRELFIRHALVYGEWNSRHRFLDTNRRLLEEAEEIEDRTRRRDIVVDEHTVFDFYDARVPADVVCGAHFDQWWKPARRVGPTCSPSTPRC